MTDQAFNLAVPKYKPSVYYFLLLLIIACIAWWPISFHIFSLKNDALNYFLPVRKLVSESYHYGILPAWTPYLNLGYPLHGDMQSGVWNPIVQLFSFFGPYTLFTLQLETLLYVVLSGIGMFCLLKHFKTHPNANIIISAGYMLCGFNSDSAQFLNWIAGASFLPFVFLCYYRLLTEKKIYWSVCTSISLYFYFNCAYPADFIILLYLLAALFLWNVFSGEQKITSALADKKKLGLHLLTIFLFLVLASPAILSYYETLPLTERGSGASYSDAMSNPLHPALLSSYFFPPSTWKMPGVYVTDPLERNSFFGIICFIFFIAALFCRSFSNLSRFCKAACLIFLLFSFGEIGGIRIVSYYILPLMDSFRHPANAKLFTIFFSCLLAAEMIHSYMRSSSGLKKIRLSMIIVTGAMIATVVVSSLISPHLNLLSLFQQTGNGFTSDIKTKIEQLTYTDIVIICFLLQLPFVMMCWRFIKLKQFKRLSVLSVLNSILFCILMQPLTVVKNKPAEDIQHLIDLNSKSSYPIPDLTSTLATNSVDNEKYFSEIGCINLYNKKIGRSDYRITPSNLLLQNQFWFNDTLRALTMNKPFIYNTAKKLASIEIKNFSPATIKGIVKTSFGDTLVISQTYHPRWQLWVNDEKQKIQKHNVAFMSFIVMNENNSFKLEYYCTDLKLLWLLSTILLLALFTYIIVGNSKSINRLSFHST